MKQVKKAYNECRAKLSNRPPDEIDFGLGFRAGVRWALSHKYDTDGCGDVINAEILEDELQ